MKQVHDIWFPDRDDHFHTSVNDDGSYQVQQFQSALHFMKAKKVFIDVGAHVGLWVKMALNNGFEGYVAFEPDPENFACLQRNLEGIKVNNGMICECAVGTSDHVELVRDNENNTGAMHTKPADSGIKCISFDKECPFEIGSVEKNEALVKIDVEGNEPDVINSMKEFIKRIKPVVIIEQKGTIEAVDTLVELGMSIRGRVNKDVVLSWD